MTRDPAEAFRANVALLERVCAENGAPKPLRRTRRFVMFVRYQIERLTLAGKAIPDADRRIAALQARANRAVASARMEAGA